MRGEEVCGHWVHTRELDAGDEMVFVTAGTDLPPSRGRVAFELRADGGFAESGLGAADVAEEAAGTWALRGDTIVLSAGAAQGVPREMEVASVDAERLVIRRRRVR